MSSVVSCHGSPVPGIEYYEALCEEVVRLLRKEREKKGLSKYAVAQRSGVSESMLSLVERNLRNPTLEILFRIADGIGADLSVLIRKATKRFPNARGERRSGENSPPGHEGTKKQKSL